MYDACCVRGKKLLASRACTRGKRSKHILPQLPTVFKEAKNRLTLKSGHRRFVPPRIPKQRENTETTIGVREGILLGGRKKFALKITIFPESNFFSLIRMGPETSCKSVLYS